MIRITQLKMNPGHSREELVEKAARLLKIAPSEMKEFQIRRQSVDARKKPLVFFTYEVLAGLGSPAREKKLVQKLRNREITLFSPVSYQLPASGAEPLPERPVVIGTGPAGLFCGLTLARAGYRPILLERGAPVEERVLDVERFWNGGPLNPESNVQFGEGGAGTFSDGKLNTLVKDGNGRNRKVLEIFVEAGAPEEILWQHRPHIGTDLLRGIVKHIREEIIRLGGEVRFHTRVKDLAVREGKLEAVLLDSGETLKTGAAVLAVGHSARDTFEMLYGHGVEMRGKAFAVGVRIEHPQEMITKAQYGSARIPGLWAADYKLTHTCSNGRGIYSFCMCPGGCVVNASSEEGRLATNGMSFHARDGRNANSALIVTVTPEDFGGEGPLAGVEFQRRLEEAAYQAGNGAVPVQLFSDFCEETISRRLGEVLPDIRGSWGFGDLRHALPKEVAESLQEGIRAFGKKIQGFDRPDAVLSGIESRTSSPIRIERGATMESSVGGLYPCGEGAGYAGGITSAAMDGLRTAEALIARFAPSAI